MGSSTCYVTQGEISQALFSLLAAAFARGEHLGSAVRPRHSVVLLDAPAPARSASSPNEPCWCYLPAGLVSSRTLFGSPASMLTPNHPPTAGQWGPRTRLLPRAETPPLPPLSGEHPASRRGGHTTA